MKNSMLSVVSVLVIVTLVTVTASPALAASWHTVQTGESLWSIAQVYGTTTGHIEQANGLTRASTIYAGQRLLVTRPGEAVHWVHHGDSFHSIAMVYGTTVEYLIDMNGRTNTNLAPGERVVVPVADGPMSSFAAAARTSANSTRSVGLTAYELDLLARAAAAEARGEPYTGQVAVASVILNRVASASFPDSVYGVVHERHQFESVMNGSINMPAGQTQRQAALDAVNGWDPSYGSVYFWNPAKANNSFLWSRPLTVRIGNHQFAR